MMKHMRVYLRIPRMDNLKRLVFVHLKPAQSFKSVVFITHYTYLLL